MTCSMLPDHKHQGALHRMSYAQTRMQGIVVQVLSCANAAPGQLGMQVCVYVRSCKGLGG